MDSVDKLNTSLILYDPQDLKSDATNKLRVLTTSQGPCVL